MKLRPVASSNVNSVPFVKSNDSNSVEPSVSKNLTATEVFVVSVGTTASFNQVRSTFKPCNSATFSAFTSLVVSSFLFDTVNDTVCCLYTLSKLSAVTFFSTTARYSLPTTNKLLATAVDFLTEVPADTLAALLANTNLPASSVLAS